MSSGKVKYDAIEIPDALGGVIDRGIERGRRRKRLSALRRTAGAAAAAVVILFAGANIAPVYSYAADIPVLGEIVRVLHVGSGGSVTDGAQTGAQSDGETVALTFTGASGGSLSEAPAYTAEHLQAPNRIVLTLHGVRGADLEEISAKLLECDAVVDVYRNMVLDDSAVGLTIVLRGGVDYEISEHANPGTLSFSFTESGEASGEVYYLRSEAMPYSETLGHLCEQYHAEDASQVKTQSGGYFVAIGQYGTKAEAEAALELLNETYGDTGFYVSSGESGEVPVE